VSDAELDGNSLDEEELVGGAGNGNGRLGGGNVNGGGGAYSSICCR
jgi:hypothetical protein